MTSKLKALPLAAKLRDINYPIIEIKDRLITVKLLDAHDSELILSFQPYQALKLTTQDCFKTVTGFDRTKIHYRTQSTWLRKLSQSLSEIDKFATFMNQSVHFIIPAGDDILEVAAWKVEISQPEKETVSFDLTSFNDSSKG